MTTTLIPSALTPSAPVEQVERPDSKKAEALEILQRGVADLITSAGWRRALEFRQRFHQYSFFNTSLILAQLPDATLVAGYRTWQKNERQVRKGERGLSILAPLLVTDRDDGTRKVLIGFRWVKVFDISQTDGEPIPQPEPPRQLQDTPQDRACVLAYDVLLEDYCMQQGVTVRRDFEHPHALGVYRPAVREIGVRTGLSVTHAFKTLVHEAAHMLLHTGTDQRAFAELEAETAAFLVCHELGIDTSSYSFAYLASWTDTLEDLVAAGDRASRAADTLLSAIRGEQRTTTATPGALAAA